MEKPKITEDEWVKLKSEVSAELTNYYCTNRDAAAGVEREKLLNRKCNAIMDMFVEIDSNVSDR